MSCGPMFIRSLIELTPRDNKVRKTIAVGVSMLCEHFSKNVLEDSTVLEIGQLNFGEEA